MNLRLLGDRKYLPQQGVIRVAWLNPCQVGLGHPDRKQSVAAGGASVPVLRSEPQTFQQLFRRRDRLAQYLLPVRCVAWFNPDIGWMAGIAGFYTGGGSLYHSDL
jgi:hypothetical protein